MIDNTITEGTRLIVRDIKEEMESAFIDVRHHGPRAA